jgi:hypothetical protein
VEIAMNRLFLCILASMVLLIPARHAEAQSTYDLDWNTVDCGGETSAQDSYDVSGSVGQPDAADLSGGDYVLSGGYWTTTTYGDRAAVVNRCGSADFNCDGDVGTDADIEAFFACVGGNCPQPPCPSTADFNGDGDVGTDADIEAFFRVLAGGSC